MIAIIDYGLGNLGSISNMLKVIGKKSRITNDIADIAASDGIILPGVGAFDAGMNMLEAKGLILNGLPGNQRYYFVHSYHAVCDDPSNVLMTCLYGYEFAAAVVKDNVIGVQFHPEKSHDFGLALLENFVKLCKESK